MPARSQSTTSPIRRMHKRNMLLDELTGLPNRAMLEQQLAMRLSRRRRNDSAQIGVSIGIALYPQDGPDAESLLKAADAAMYAAKEAGRNTWRFAARVSPSTSK